MDHSPTAPTFDTHSLNSQDSDIAFYHTMTFQSCGFLKWCSEERMSGLHSITPAENVYRPVPVHGSTLNHVAVVNADGATPVHDGDSVYGGMPMQDSVPNAYTTLGSVFVDGTVSTIPGHNDILSCNPGTTLSAIHIPSAVPADPTIPAVSGLAKASGMGSDAVKLQHPPYQVIKTGSSTTHLCICGSRVKRKKDLERHWNTRVHRAKTFPCPLCRKGYSRKYQLKKHKCKGVQALDGTNSTLLQLVQI